VSRRLKDLARWAMRTRRVGGQARCLGVDGRGGLAVAGGGGISWVLIDEGVGFSVLLALLVFLGYNLG
jgi:hypothetical protein